MLAACGGGGDTVEADGSTTTMSVADTDGTVSGDGTEGTVSGDGTGSDEGTAAVDAEGFDVTALVDGVPRVALEPGWALTVTDYERLGEIAGVSAPTGDPSAEELTRWWLVVLGGIDNPETGEPPPIAVVAPQALSTADPRTRSELGFDVAEVSSSADVTAPPMAFTVLTGDFDPDAATGLVDLGDGIMTWGDGEDFLVDVQNGDPLISPLGTPVRVGRRGDEIALSSSTPAVRAWLDGDETALAEPGVADFARIMDGFGPVTAGLYMTAPHSLAVEANLMGGDPPEGVEPYVLEHGPGLVGYGVDVADSTRTAVITYHFDSAGDAAAAAPVIGDWLTEGLSSRTGMAFDEFFTVSEVQAEDAVVVVHLELAPDAPPTIPHQMILSLDIVPFTP